jgi:hypothetical protein
MSASSLAGVFEEVTLIKRVPVDEPTGADQWGNPVYDTVALEFTARLKVTGNNALIERLGIDDKEVVLEGAFVKPAIIPETIRKGARFEMDWRGAAGAATLRQIKPRALLVVDEALGQQIVLSWIPQEAQNA